MGEDDKVASCDLRDKESAKIECGKAHFRSLAVGENPARYIVARSANDLLVETDGGQTAVANPTSVIDKSLTGSSGLYGETQSLTRVKWIRRASTSLLIV
jgi:hypothetical protein